jgi:hypothetical protein
VWIGLDWFRIRSSDESWLNNGLTNNGFPRSRRKTILVLDSSTHFATFEVLTVVKIQVEVFWVVTPCGVAVGHVVAPILTPEDGSKMVLRNVGILPQHYTVSQHRRARL